jgi:hypothetical protein
MPQQRSLTCIIPVLLVFAFTAAGCSSKDPVPAPAPVAAAAEESPAQVAELEATVRALEDRASRAELGLLERDARVLELEQRLESQQRLLDETIAEVVRTKAKLRGTESRAEAASQMAEAEIALKALGDRPHGGESPEYRQAVQLLGLSAAEFEAENYGGAIYLTSQAKSLISLGQVRLSERAEIETTAGEVLFGVPLPLAVLRTSNVREGPGTEFRVIVTLRQGTPLTGYSYKGEWIRVKLEDGTQGWIHQALASNR